MSRSQSGTPRIQCRAVEDRPPQNPQKPEPPSRIWEEVEAAPRLGGSAFFADWFGFLLKNLLGYVFLGLAVVLGPLPGPGGVVFFLIGFGLITFPGKRRLMARIFRGRRFDLSHWAAHAAAVVFAGLAPWAVLAWFVWREKGWFHAYRTEGHATAIVYVCLAMAMWAVALGLLRFFNWLIKIFPKIRRTVRPWLRHRGIDLLPPRIRQRVRGDDGEFHWRPNESGEIVRIHQRHRDKLAHVWLKAKPWVKRALGLGITIAIFAWMLKPVVTNWEQVAPYVRRIKWGYFGIASVMFAFFLFAFRVMSWRTILSGFGHRLPLAPAARIWSTSELARYLPGAIWQVVGRVYLVRPYGVGGTVCSVSQLLELVVFLLANVLVALGCLAWFAHRPENAANQWLMVVAASLAPLLMALLHPKVFYTGLTKYMAWRGKQLPPTRVRGKTLTFLTVWAIVGLLWQSLAIWLLVKSPLKMDLDKWWVVGGAYCLAWCAGFIAFWAPGGLGVREFVFMTAMMFAIPPRVRAQFHGNDAVLAAFLAFVGVLLRLWATVGELILTSVAYVLDLKGALGHADAPGRVVGEPASAGGSREATEARQSERDPDVTAVRP